MSAQARYRVRFTGQAAKGIAKLSAKLRAKLMDISRYRPAVDPHFGKPLAGPFKGYYSVRLSYQNRILCSIQDDELVVIVVRANPLRRLTVASRQTRRLPSTRRLASSGHQRARPRARRSCV